MLNGNVNIDTISLIIDILGFASAIIIFIITSKQDRKAVEEQTRRETVRATLTDFAELRRNHVAFQKEIVAENITDEERNYLIKEYLGDLERFATGYNLGAYDLGIINKMSGGLLVMQYSK